MAPLFVFYGMIYVYPGSPVDQAKNSRLGMIHISRIPDPTKRQSLVFGLPGYVYVSGWWFHFFFFSQLFGEMIPI